MLIVDLLFKSLFKQKANDYPVQPLKFKDFPLVFVLCDGKLNIVWFWMVGRTKQASKQP